MRSPVFACLLLLIGTEGFPTGNIDTEKKVNEKPAQEITVERILHLGQGINKKVRQQDPLSSSNSDGYMQLPTRFRTKRSAALDADYKQYNSLPDGSYQSSYYGQGLTSTNPHYPKTTFEHNYEQPLQTIYYPQMQNEYLKQYQTEYVAQGNAYNNLLSNEYDSNPLLNRHYYNANQPNEYINMQEVNALSHQPQQYYYHQPQYVQSLHNSVYQPPPNPYYSAQLDYYSQPLQYNAMWNANSYWPPSSSHPALVTNENAPFSACQNELHTGTGIGALGNIGALTAAVDGVNGGNNINGVGYHELIDALYDENDLGDESNSSEEFYDQG